MLHNIYQLPPDQSQVQLARATSIEQPSSVYTLDQLEEEGPISQRTCVNGRQAKRIKLIEKAEPLITDMKAVINKTRGEVLERVSTEEIDPPAKPVAKLEHNTIEPQLQD